MDDAAACCSVPDSRGLSALLTASDGITALYRQSRELHSCCTADMLLEDGAAEKQPAIPALAARQMRCTAPAQQPSFDGSINDACAFLTGTTPAKESLDPATPVLMYFHVLYIKRYYTDSSALKFFEIHNSIPENPGAASAIQWVQMYKHTLI